MYTADQLDLLSHLQKRNAETQAWIDAEPNRWASFITEDLDYWAQVGIKSVAEYERDSLISFISDVHKDVYGFRPRWDFDSMSMEELDLEAERLSQDANAQVEREREEEAHNYADFEERVTDLMQTGAGDRETAIRWIIESLGDDATDVDGGYICHLLGISYSHSKLFEPALRELGSRWVPEAEEV